MSLTRDSTLADPQQIIADLRRERDEALAREAATAEALARRNSEYIERIEQQAATIDVLKVMSASPGDPQPVFDLIAVRARDLCDAYGVTVLVFDGTLVHHRASTGISDDPARREAVIASFPTPPAARPTIERVIRERRILRIDDLDAVYDRNQIALPDVKSLVTVPMLRGETVIGALAMGGLERGCFSDTQVELLQTFAEQAVIAITSAEAHREQHEVLEQQTATAEVLQVINSSPGDLTPVFDVMLEKATRLCGAAFGSLLMYDGQRFENVAVLNVPEAFAEFAKPGRSISFGPGTGPYRLLAGEELVHITDGREEEAYCYGDPAQRALIELAGARSWITVALRKDDALMGAITVFRQEVQPFTDKQIALLQNFAAQAVIAIENARLINATREALEQQTATAEVLQVINSSPGDLAPVFEAMLERAMRLCGGSFGVLAIFDGEHYRIVANYGLPTGLAEFVTNPIRIETGSMPERVQHGEHTIQVLDITAVAAHDRTPGLAAMIESGKARTALWVGLHRDGFAQGFFGVYRQEVRPFSEEQVVLLQNFAAQAVIAMENARLITETHEALEQQTATAEVLGVINASPGDVSPVFNAMLEKAMRLCGAAFGMLRSYDGQRFNTVTALGVPEAYARFLQQNRDLAVTGSGLARLVEGDPFVDTPDAQAEQRFSGPVWQAMVELGGARAVLAVPLRKDDKLIGTITIYRQEPGAFSDKEIALLQNFAAQAVIAMENARLITETREALERQTATAEVLGVINASPGDLKPVFDTILEKSMRLCEAGFGELLTYDGVRSHTVAMRGVPEAFAAYRSRNLTTPPRRGSFADRVLEGHQVVHILDLKDEEIYKAGDPNRRAIVDLGGARTALIVALRKDGALLGFIILFRQEVRPFSDTQIALVENFAAQAVIAMENARLITETQEALDQQTATAEVLGVINASPGDLAPVFDIILQKAHTLCGAVHGHLTIYDGQNFRAVATHGVPEEFAKLLRQPFRPGADLAEQLLSGQPIFHVYDIAAQTLAPDDQIGRAAVELGGARTLLAIPLRKDGALLGYITAHRQEVRPFAEKEIALLKNFAAQAVIAMENARLLGDLRERTEDLSEALEYQTATSDVLKVISQSDADLRHVLQSALDTAARLCEVGWGHIFLRRGDHLQTMASLGATFEHRADMDTHPVGVDAHSASGRAVLTGQVVHIADIAGDSEYAHTATREAGIRTMLGVPLLRDGVPIGSMSLARKVVEPFTERQIELVRTFADQAVIAIENARLLDEIRQRQAELRVTFDNMADGVAMFDEDLRLAAWNRNFQQIADLPETLLAERPSYADYLGILTDRGELDIGRVDQEITDRLDHTDEELRLERTRPNGQVIEVRRNAVPDGGFVLIYSDITERKRSEAEIRAARDAAEATLRDLRAAQANLVQAEKMASLGQLTAGIAHEIKNPLNFVNNFASLSTELLGELKEAAEPFLAHANAKTRAGLDETIEMLTGNLDKIVEHGQRADNIVKSMLEHSRGVSGERREIDLNGLIEEALNLAYHGARAHDPNFNITLERDYGEGLKPIELAPQEMTRVFLNLFGNGFYAAHKRASANGNAAYSPTLTVATRDSEDGIEVRVRDNGTGISPEIKDKLFQPFFTTKPTGEGTGLGLSISYDIVTQQHGGTIVVESEEGAYTEFTIHLPRH
jgi:GAF domain-containing protein